MNKNLIYFIGGGVFLYFLLKSGKAKAQEKPKDETPEEDGVTSVTGVGDVVKNSRNFEFSNKNEEEAYSKAYDLQYVGDKAPQNGDLLVVTWCATNFCRKSTFQYFDRMWKRFANPRRSNMKKPMLIS